MQCPGCEYTVLGTRSCYPSQTHCCESCSYAPGTHGPRCARHLSAYVEYPRVCPHCREYAITGVCDTHCCGSCAIHAGEHDANCQRRQPHWEFRHEYSSAVKLRMRRHEYTSIAYTENRQQNVYLNRCAYVMLLYGCDVEYALGVP